jgi:hypothetical protein
MIPTFTPRALPGELTAADRAALRALPLAQRGRELRALTARRTEAYYLRRRDAELAKLWSWEASEERAARGPGLAKTRAPAAAEKAGAA